MNIRKMMICMTVVAATTATGSTGMAKSRADYEVFAQGDYWSLITAVFRPGIYNDTTVIPLATSVKEEHAPKPDSCRGGIKFVKNPRNGVVSKEYC
jgi:hypothetical protein